MLVISVVGIIILIVGAIFFFIDYAKGNKKKVSYIIMAVGVIVAAGGYWAQTYQVKQAQIRQAQLKKQKEKTFADNYGNIKYYAYTTGVKAEKIGNKFVDVWHDAIWEDSGVTIDGKSYTDFNKALQAQYDVYSSDGTIDKMDTALKHLESTYAKCRENVTAKNQAKLTKAKQTVKDAKHFVKLVESPSGNYATFSSNVSDADSTLSTDL